MERKEMYSHMFKFRASCLKLSPEKLQGSVPIPPHCMFYLVVVWCKIHFKNCYQRNQTTVSSSKGESPTYWCNRVMNVRTHLLSVLLLKLIENGECLGHTQSYPWRCVFFCAGIHAWIKGTLTFIYFIEQMCETNSFCLYFLPFLPILTPCNSEKVLSNSSKCLGNSRILEQFTMTGW